MADYPAAPAASVVASAAAEDVMVALTYDPTGLAWVDMKDFGVVAWGIDLTGSSGAVPFTLSPLPVAAPDVRPIISPPWIVVRQAVALANNEMWRGQVDEMFDFLANNNGAARQLRGDFVSPTLRNSWSRWSMQNPGKVW